MIDKSQDSKMLPLVRAATIGPKNAVAVTGASWRHWRTHAPVLGVRVYKAGRKPFIVVDELIAALQRQGSELPANDLGAAAQSVADVDAAAYVRTLLGKRLTGGGK